MEKIILFISHIHFTITSFGVQNKKCLVSRKNRAWFPPSLHPYSLSYDTTHGLMSVIRFPRNNDQKKCQSWTAFSSIALLSSEQGRYHVCNVFHLHTYIPVNIRTCTDQAVINEANSWLLGSDESDLVKYWQVPATRKVSGPTAPRCFRNIILIPHQLLCCPFPFKKLGYTARQVWSNFYSLDTHSATAALPELFDNTFAWTFWRSLLSQSCLNN